MVELFLEDGFFRDTVEVSAGGQLLAQLAEATTRVQVGLAAQLTIDVPPGNSLHLRRGEDEVDLTVDPATPCVGVSLTDHGFTARYAATPFPRA